MTRTSADSLVTAPPPAPGRPGPVATDPARRYRLVLTAGMLALAGAVIGGIGLGSSTVPVTDVLASLGHHLTSGVADILGRIGIHLPSVVAPPDSLSDMIVWRLRVPRTLAAAIVGVALGLAGTVLQAMVRNPLADPYVLGVSSGASLTAALVMSSASAVWIRNAGVPSAAFVGALGALLLVLVFAHRRGTFTGSRIVLAGVGVGQVAAAATALVQLHAEPAEIRGMLFWMMGSVAGVDALAPLLVPAIGVTACAAVLFGSTRSLNALALGDDDAVALGVHVNAFRVQMIVIAAVLTGMAVSVAGGVGFVGLMAPHVARFLVGADHRRVLPVAAVLSAGFVVLVDTVARTVDAPNEYPLTIITAAVGGPFFLWLLRRSRTGGAV
ncbi:iron chelate uptake ABC transporter family permease subunit [Gordonia sinesedis]